MARQRPNGALQAALQPVNERLERVRRARARQLVPTREPLPFEARPKPRALLAPPQAEVQPPPVAYVYDPIRGAFLDDLARRDVQARQARERAGRRIEPVDLQSLLWCWRHARGLSRAKAGQLLGVSGRMVSLYEDGHCFPRPAQLARIRDVLAL